MRIVVCSIFLYKAVMSLYTYSLEGSGFWQVQFWGFLHLQQCIKSPELRFWSHVSRVIHCFFEGLLVPRKIAFINICLISALTVFSMWAAVAFWLPRKCSGMSQGPLTISGTVSSASDIRLYAGTPGKILRIVVGFLGHRTAFSHNNAGRCRVKYSWVE